MKVAIIAKVKNGVLWELSEQLGGVQALAEYLGLSYQYTIHLMNMRAYPGFRRKSQLDWDAIGEKLLKLTGLTLDEIFPLELATSQMLERPLKWALIRDVEPEQLTAAHERLALPAAQEAILEREDLKEQIARTLGMLTPRQERVMRYRFGLDGQDAHTLAETARHLKLSPERIRQIEANALRRLRHKAYRKYLEPYVT